MNVKFCAALKSQGGLISTSCEIIIFDYSPDKEITSEIFLNNHSKQRIVYKAMASNPSSVLIKPANIEIDAYSSILVKITYKGDFQLNQQNNNAEVLLPEKIMFVAAKIEDETSPEKKKELVKNPFDKESNTIKLCMKIRGVEKTLKDIEKNPKDIEIQVLSNQISALREETQVMRAEKANLDKAVNELSLQMKEVLAILKQIQQGNQ